LVKLKENLVALYKIIANQQSTIMQILDVLELHFKTDSEQGGDRKVKDPVISIRKELAG